MTAPSEPPYRSVEVEAKDGLVHLTAWSRLGDGITVKLTPWDVHALVKRLHNAEIEAAGGYENMVLVRDRGGYVYVPQPEIVMDDRGGSQ